MLLVVKKADPPPKQKSHSKEPKREEKKPKVEVSKPSATTVTVTSQGTSGITETDPKAYLVTNSAGQQSVAYFDNNVCYDIWNETSNISN